MRFRRRRLQPLTVFRCSLHCIPSSIKQTLKTIPQHHCRLSPPRQEKEKKNACCDITLLLPIPTSASSPSTHCPISNPTNPRHISPFLLHSKRPQSPQPTNKTPLRRRTHIFHNRHLTIHPTHTPPPTPNPAPCASQPPSQSS